MTEGTFREVGLKEWFKAQVWSLGFWTGLVAILILVFGLIPTFQRTKESCDSLFEELNRSVSDGTLPLGIEPTGGLGNDDSGAAFPFPSFGGAPRSGTIPT